MEELIKTIFRGDLMDDFYRFRNTDGGFRDMNIVELIKFLGNNGKGIRVDRVVREDLNNYSTFYKKRDSLWRDPNKTKREKKVLESQLSKRYMKYSLNTSTNPSDN